MTSQTLRINGIDLIRLARSSYRDGHPGLGDSFRSNAHRAWREAKKFEQTERAAMLDNLLPLATAEGEIGLSRFTFSVKQGNTPSPSRN